MANNEETKKKPIYKKWWFWVIIIVIIIAIGGSQGEKQDTSTTSSTTNSVSNATNESQEKTEYNQGEEAILGDGLILVTDVKKSQGSEYIKPKTGYEYVTISLTIKNIGKSNLSYNPYYFKLQNGQGQQLDITYSGIEDNDLNSGELIPGGTVSGNITFEAPKNDTNLVLIYSDNIWSSKELKIKLQ